VADPLRFGPQAELCRAEPCAGCGAPPPCDPDHVTTRGAGGLDSDCAPLCRVCHVERHALGIATFEARASERLGRPVDLAKVAAFLAHVVARGPRELPAGAAIRLSGTPVLLLEPDPRAFRFAVRFASRSSPSRTYDVALSNEGWWSCECFPFLRSDTCSHLDAARAAWARLRSAPTWRAKQDVRDVLRRVHEGQEPGQNDDLCGQDACERCGDDARSTGGRHYHQGLWVCAGCRAVLAPDPDEDTP
jgi:hypothetical protein